MNNRKPAGFWIRFLATLIDGILGMVLTSIIKTITGEKSTTGDLFPTQDINDTTMGFWEIVKASYSPAEVTSNIIYAIVFVIIFTGIQFKGSPGKLICRIEVVNPDMSKISIPKSIGRYLSYIISSITLMIGFMMAGWNKEKKALHDIICNTRVVYRK